MHSGQHMIPSKPACCLLLLLGFLVLGTQLVSAIDIEAAPIHYSEEETQDAIAQLQLELAAGEVSLQGESSQEVLAKLLDYLSIPKESQVLVYSKTSAQNSRIMPSRPRAIYFSDDAYVGWVQGGQAEILTFDPIKGAMFYLMDIRTATNAREPTFERPASCLNCHERSSTGDVPGGLVRSVFARADGMPLFSAGTFYVEDETELENRWGGWYVTGDSGSERHMGNRIAYETSSGVEMRPVTEHPESLQDLSGIIKTEPYLHGGSSDIVALMILEHQIETQNLISHASLSVRQLEYNTEQIYRSMKMGDASKSETLQRVIRSQAKRIVQQLLFEDEYQIEGDGVDGDLRFQEAFASNARASADGRSLKDFRLYERLFKYRCSYVIYSQVFDHMPASLKAEVYAQLYRELHGSTSTEISDHIAARERANIFQILQETKEGLPDYWREDGE